MSLKNQLWLQHIEDTETLKKAGNFRWKIEEGETSQELVTENSVGELIDTIEYDYSSFYLFMDYIWSEIVYGDWVLTEHEIVR